MAQNLKCGDLIEIFRGLYQHWAIYVGDGYVVHLVPPSEHGSSGASSAKSVVHNRARVKKEKLKDVAGRNKYRINNHLDMQLEPRHIQDILQEANRFVGKEVPYDLEKSNCEHFVKLLRYGVPRSQQVEEAVDTVNILTIAAAAFGIFFALLRN